MAMAMEGLARLACVFSTAILLQSLAWPCSNGERGFSFSYPQSPKVPSIVSERYRTAYHFQPPRNWMNGMLFTSLLPSSASSLVHFVGYLFTFVCAFLVMGPRKSKRSDWLLICPTGEGKKSAHLNLVC
ncbi:unnamed protein product [Triticum turgidum subsp. durum]|uniref:Uncharacterized protein n=1 Tax=Triticum turgidum subsp. durum TaxID=4567 RepID=A0A9R0XPD2_TRITD|nr:unnamed protein product [Triticum turgidum subsp. durum]